MKQNKSAYWALTGCITFFMFFSAFYSGTNPAAFKQLGFPEYFRIELTSAKIFGAILLLIPQVSLRVKEWIYVAFSINLVSAAIAKLNSGYSVLSSMEPLLVLLLMLIAIRSLNRINKHQQANSIE
ncbi:DoxX family protein [Mucilaginibacter celer]|uniref:DoxX family protein n=1 Tax=Mucilaginibacter celer TaxID=2305508 RepID=A0A494VTP3_9SPHI|nr:DoxX family protein [Mucilaginibacter celer]AYL96800.1 DoxX family protein [Mucilaginibacter celer]